jgi:hypothetical protein
MAIEMRTSKPTRKQLFFAALNIAGLTQEAWAEQTGVTSYHLYLVLKGDRHSPPLMEKVDAFIEKQITTAASAA